MNLLIVGSHGTLEHDDVQLFSRLGYDVFSPGGYEHPEAPTTDFRPALPDAPNHPDLAALCHAQRVKHGAKGLEWALDWAKADLHPDLIDWADTVMVNCYPERWITSQWERLKGKRVIWRTIGQSGPDTERLMKPLRFEGLEIVRYSPAEQRAFGKHDFWAGEDAMIRFAKDPDEWYGWTGSDPVVGNVTQSMVERAEFCGLRFWRLATEGLPVKPAGKQSEMLGGVGPLTYEGLKRYLRECRVYLYTGTQPASYTLGLIEGLMTGTPTVSIGRSWMWSPDLFEASEIAPLDGYTAEVARAHLDAIINDRDYAEAIGQAGRQTAVELFSIETVGAQWRAFLGDVRGTVALAAQPLDVQPVLPRVPEMVMSNDANASAASLAVLRPDDLAGDGCVPDRGPGTSSVRWPVRWRMGLSIAARSLGACARRAVAALGILPLGRGVVFGNRPLAGFADHRHDDNAEGGWF